MGRVDPRLEKELRSVTTDQNMLDMILHMHTELGRHIETWLIEQKLDDHFYVQDGPMHCVRTPCLPDSICVIIDDTYVCPSPTVDPEEKQKVDAADPKFFSKLKQLLILDHNHSKCKL